MRVLVTLFTMPQVQMGCLKFTVGRDPCVCRHWVIKGKLLELSFLREYALHAYVAWLLLAFKEGDYESMMSTNTFFQILWTISYFKSLKIRIMSLFTIFVFVTCMTSAREQKWDQTISMKLPDFT